jgi:hypothetical protein
MVSAFLSSNLLIYVIIYFVVLGIKTMALGTLLLKHT